MIMRILYALAAMGAGVAASFQGAANSGLAGRTGLGAALVINTTLVLIGSIVFFVVSGSRAVFFTAGAPWFLYVGGLCGFVFILANAFVFPKIGAGAAVALVVLGQGAAAVLLDHFGLMGLPRQPVSLSRLAGVALIV